MREVYPTPALDALLAVFRMLTRTEQEAALRQCHEVWLEAETQMGSEMTQAIQSLKRVAELTGEAPGIEDYKRIRSELQKDGEDLMPASRIIRLTGSWHQAKEALDLIEVTTPRRINSRFRKRRLGKVWRYTEETLQKTLHRCVGAIEHVPQVAEFEWWRQRELELAQARGEDLHLPAAAAYRRRYGTWEQTLLHFGFTPDQVAERLERTAQRTS